MAAARSSGVKVLGGAQSSFHSSQQIRKITHDGVDKIFLMFFESTYVHMSFCFRMSFGAIGFISVRIQACPAS